MNNRTSRGFTLIEILVALGVLAVGVTSVFALFATGGATHRKAMSQTAAAFISDSVFSELRERLDVFANVRDLAVPDGAGKVSGYPGFTYQLDLTPLDVEENEFLATCTVRWKKEGVPVSVAFRTVVFRRLPASARGRMPSPTDPDASP